MSDEPMKCPHCEKEFALAMTARRKAETVLSFVINVEEGHMLTAATVGGVLTNFDKMIAAMSREMGGRCLSMVKGMNRAENGALKFDFLIVTNESEIYKKEKANSKPNSGENSK